MEPDGTVWIVQHDESPDNTILGVFASQEEATVFAEEIQDQLVHGVITSSFPLGYRFDRGSSRYRGEQQADAASRDTMGNRVLRAWW